MDWSGWAVYGLLATAALTVVMIISQLSGWTRLDLPLMLGTIVVGDPDRARLAGFFVHLANGQIFALVYAAVFALTGRATAVAGGLLGLFHGLVALVLIVPLLPMVHPRMASPRAGVESTDAVLEPPGLFALNYGKETPLVALIAHLAYGIALGLLLRPS